MTVGRSAADPGRDRAPLASALPRSPGLDERRIESRRLFPELFGTFLLVLVGAGATVVGALGSGAIGRPAAVAAPGLMVMAIILFMGAVSGAHLNPAVTLAFGLRGDFPWRRVPGYVLAQGAGAALACLFLWGVYGKVGRLGATEPGIGISDWQALLTELALTVGLVSTILVTASRAQNVGPLAGAVIAVGIAWILRGPGGDPGGLAAARGTLDPLTSRPPASGDPL